MSDSSIDVLMRVVSNGQAMQAECTTTFVRGTAPDILGLGFKAGQFCELTSFDFSVGFASSLGDDDDDDEGEDGSAPDAKPSAPPKVKQAKSGPTEFSDIQPVGFTRLMDTMSTLLFKAMTECETLDLISVVKRKAAGSSNSGECYLRLDFDKVLVTGLTWRDSGDWVMESGSFIYRAVTIKYRPQLPNGTLGAVNAQKWTMPAGA